MISVAPTGRIHERTRPISKTLSKSLAPAGPSIHEALDETVLHRFPRRDEVPVDDCVLAPGEHDIAGELSAMVGYDLPGLPRRSTIAVSSRATRRPEIDVSGIAPGTLW